MPIRPSSTREYFIEGMTPFFIFSLVIIHHSEVEINLSPTGVFPKPIELPTSLSGLFPTSE